MRYIFLIGLLMSACTKANPEAVGATPDLAGGGGGNGGGNGGGGGGGTGGGPHDMTAPPERHDLAVPPDMAGFAGVACGTTTCSDPHPDCCATNGGGLMCIDSSTTDCGGALFTCDGPEDCGPPGEVCCLRFTSSQNGSVCQLGCLQGAILCHVVADCPPAQGYVGCCPLQQGSQYRRCSKTAC
jgi:hypothetical protein